MSTDSAVVLFFGARVRRDRPDRYGDRLSGDQATLLDDGHLLALRAPSHQRWQKARADRPIAAAPRRATHAIARVRYRSREGRFLALRDLS